MFTVSTLTSTQLYIPLMLSNKGDIDIGVTSKESMPLHGITILI